MKERTKEIIKTIAQVTWGLSSIIIFLWSSEFIPPKYVLLMCVPASFLLYAHFKLMLE